VVRIPDRDDWDYDANALAGFWLFRVGTGRLRDAQEGRFKAPVEITFTADPASVPGGCS